MFFCMITFLRHCIFYGVFFLWTALCSIAAVVCSAVFSVLFAWVDDKKQQHFLFGLGRVWAHGMLAATHHLLGINYRVTGLENMPENTPFVVACKHQSMWETIALLTMVRNPVFVLKHSLMTIPFFGRALKKTGMIPVVRGRQNKHFIEKAHHAIQSNNTIIIFPEGRRTPPGEKTRYFKGIFYIYHHCSIPVIPVALNSGIFWPRRTFFKRKGTITVSFLQAIDVGLPETEFMQSLTQSIESCSAHLAHPFLP